MSAPERRLPAAVHVLDDASVQLIHATAAAVASITQTLGVSSPDGKGGTGLAGQVAELRSEVRGLVALKNTGRGVLIGAVLVGALLLLGLANTIKALGFTAFGF